MVAAAPGHSRCVPAVAFAGEDRVVGEFDVSAAKGAVHCLFDLLGAADALCFFIVMRGLFDMVLQLRVLFLNIIVPLYYDQVDVLLMMTTSLSTTYLLIQYLNKIRQKELNPGIKDFDEKIQIIANLTFSLVIALFKPEKLNTQQRLDAHTARTVTNTTSHPPPLLLLSRAESPSW